MMWGTWTTVSYSSVAVEYLAAARARPLSSRSPFFHVPTSSFALDFRRGGYFARITSFEKRLSVLEQRTSAMAPTIIRAAHVPQRQGGSGGRAGGAAGARV